ncbi:PLD nuclease N-terminal domain-containing protein [Carnobacterium gallinarum]|uniref:PLD nuclease N-terminal domain-containing protein n=1 Tax=Carnobacterium gallinarum TaxID=2749 RepID=UPI00068E0C1E|nr:PLD nuclease N-terminal domain-containing protein [Carnobacterium gallinarum]
MNLHMNIQENFDFKAILPIIILYFILILIALVDLIRYRKERKNVGIWFAVVILVSMFGPIVYFIFGRKEKNK